MYSIDDFLNFNWGCADKEKLMNLMNYEPWKLWLVLKELKYDNKLFENGINLM